MDRLNISPLRGLIDFWIALSYNLFILSGLKKMTLKTNHEKTEIMCHFGLNSLFDGHLIIRKFLCDGYVIVEAINWFSMLIFNDFLCDDYVIGSPFLFDNYLIKVMK